MDTSIMRTAVYYAAYLSSEAVHYVAIVIFLPLTPWASTTFASAVATVLFVRWKILDCR